MSRGPSLERSPAPQQVPCTPSVFVTPHFARVPGSAGLPPPTPEALGSCARVPEGLETPSPAPQPRSGHPTPVPVVPSVGFAELFGDDPFG